MSEANTDVLKYFEAVDLDSLDQKIQQKVQFATELFAELSRLIKSMTLYGAEHQSSLNFRNRFFEVLNRGLAGGSSISVEVQNYALVIAEQTVYENPKIENNFIYKFYTDGIRSITLNYGMTAKEVDQLLNIFILDWDDTALFEDDAVTLLWAQHFEHVSYEVAPQTQNNDVQEESHIVPLSKQLDRLSDLLRTCPQGVSFESFGNLIDQQQQQQIQQVTHINQRELLEKLIALSYASQQNNEQEKLKGQEHLIKVLDQLALLFSKRQDVSELERFLKQAFRITKGYQEQLRTLWSNPKMTQSILKPLQTEDHQHYLSAFACLNILGSQCTPYIASKIGEIAPKHLSTLGKLTIPYLSQYPIEICRAIRKGDYIQGKRLIHWVYQTNHKELALKVFKTATEHTDQGVRYEALLNISESIMQDHTVLDVLCRGIHDEYSKIRSLSIYTLAYSSHSKTKDYINSLIQDKKVQEFSFIDVRKLYATAALQGIDTKFFYDMSQKKTALLGKQKDLKYAALTALAMSNDGHEYQEYLQNLSHKRLSSQLQQDTCKWGIAYLSVNGEQRKKMAYELFFRGILSMPKGYKS